MYKLVLSGQLYIVISLSSAQMVAALNKYESWIEYMHFSDQFSGPRIQE